MESRADVYTRSGGCFLQSPASICPRDLHVIFIRNIIGYQFINIFILLRYVFIIEVFFSIKICKDYSDENINIIK